MSKILVETIGGLGKFPESFRSQAWADENPSFYMAGVMIGTALLLTGWVMIKITKAPVLIVNSVLKRESRVL